MILPEIDLHLQEIALKVLHDVQPLFDLAQFIQDQELVYVNAFSAWWDWDFTALFRSAMSSLHSTLSDLLHFDDRFHSVEEICLENGFGYESFNITTKDGYILRLDHVLPSN